MFIVRYIDVNKTVHMRIKSKIAVSTAAIGTLVAAAYYSGSKIFQAAAFVVVAVYSVAVNMDYVQMAVGKVKKILHRS